MGISESFKRGTAELMILTILKHDDMYGYQLSTELQNKSHGKYVLQEGSMYPVLYRLVEKGMITGREEKVNRRIRVYYHLEERGKEYLETMQQEYLSLLSGTLDVLEISDMEVIKTDVK